MWVDYFKAARQIGVTPVYPPNESLQVGDVIYVQYDPTDENDLSQTRQVWLGTFDSMRDVSNEYLTSRVNFVDTTTDSNKIELSQVDLVASTVTLNDGARRTLPLVSLPTITGAASTAARLAEMNPGRFQCPEGLVCQVAIVTNTIVTRQFDYTYSSAAIASAAATALETPPVADTPQTLPLPGNLNVDVTLQPDPAGKELSKLVAGLNDNVAAARLPGTASTSARFVGLRGNGLVFERTFIKPIAVGYEALADSPNWYLDNICLSDWEK